MGNKKLVEKIKKYFSKDFRKKIENAETLRQVIAHLETKGNKILAKLEDDPGPKEKKLLKKQLKIIRIQIKKARKKLEE